MPWPAILATLAPYIAQLGASAITSSMSSENASQPQDVEEPLYSPGQRSALDQLLSSGLNGLNNPTPRKQFDFAPIANQARQNYQEQTLPTLLERFGNMNAAGTSGFQNQVLKAGGDFESALAALQAQFGMQGEQLNQNQEGMDLSKMFNLLGLGLTPQTQRATKPARPGSGFEGYASNFISALPDLIKKGFGEYDNTQQNTPGAQKTTGGRNGNWLANNLGISKNQTLGLNFNPPGS